MGKKNKKNRDDKVKTNNMKSRHEGKKGGKKKRKKKELQPGREVKQTNRVPYSWRIDVSSRNGTRRRVNNMVFCFRTKSKASIIRTTKERKIYIYKQHMKYII